MKSTDAINTIQKQADAIRLLKDELDKSRNINLRYFLEKGQYVKGGELDVSDAYEFSVKPTDDNMYAKVQLHDCSVLNERKSDYQRILQLLEELE